MKVRRKLLNTEKAVQWFPDLAISSGYDQYGVEYTVTEYTVRTDYGTSQLQPGDWLIVEVSDVKK